MQAIQNYNQLLQLFRIGISICKHKRKKDIYKKLRVEPGFVWIRNMDYTKG